MDLCNECGGILEGRYWHYPHEGESYTFCDEHCFSEYEYQMHLNEGGTASVESWINKKIGRLQYENGKDEGAIEELLKSIARRRIKITHRNDRIEEEMERRSRLMSKYKTYAA